MKHSTAPVRHRIARWDACEIAIERAHILRQDDPGLSEDEAFQLACNDTDVLQLEWEWLLDDLDAVLRRLSPEGCFRAEGRNMGWRGLAGSKLFRADDAQAFLDAILPRTECSFAVELEGDALHIVNRHHDAPVGEAYTVVACSPALLEDN